MGNNKYNGYFILEIPEPFSIQIQKIRDKYDKFTAQLPVEITVAGSSGIGPIIPNQSIDDIINEVNNNIDQIKSFNFNFLKISSFPNTDIYYLEPEQRKNFDFIHNVLKGLNIKYLNNNFPYNPHCTIRTGNFINIEDKESIMKENIPKDKIAIKTLSFIEFNSKPFELNYFYKWKI